MSIRLINTDTLETTVFMGEEPPSYAILLHTWESGEEVNLLEFEALLTDENHPARRKRGFQKIIKLCAQAKSMQIDYAWIDTCCIDKTCSAELNEAINSMFKWYEQALVCYAFLSDLAPGAELEGALKDCRWFTRGWCLQELLAPNEVIFFDRQWNAVGTRFKLKDPISKITRIDKDVLINSQRMYELPIARRMSWAARRHTTRVEDQAYCLLGLFEVNMPMLYGEGDRAFLRLQEEIIKRSSDLSIFHNSYTIDENKVTQVNRKYLYGRWTSSDADIPMRQRSPFGIDLSESETDDAELAWMSKSKRWPYRNLFARSPKAFIHSHDVVFCSPYPDSPSAARSTPYGIPRDAEFTVTQQGVRFNVEDIEKVACFRGSEDQPVACYLINLHCKRAQAPRKAVMVLKKVGPDNFIRLRHSWLRLGWVDRQRLENQLYWNGRSRTITVFPLIKPSMIQGLDRSDYHAIKFDITTVAGRRVWPEWLRAEPDSHWEFAYEQSHFLTQGLRFAGYLEIDSRIFLGGQREERFAQSRTGGWPLIFIACGLDIINHGDNPWSPWIYVHTRDRWQQVFHDLDYSRLPWGPGQETFLFYQTYFSDLRISPGFSFKLPEIGSERRSSLQLGALLIEAEISKIMCDGRGHDSRPVYQAKVRAMHLDQTDDASRDQRVATVTSSS